MEETWQAPRNDQFLMPETLSNVTQQTVISTSVSQMGKTGRDPGIFPCPGCKKMYRYRRNMLSHFRLECGQMPQLQCGYCSYRSKKKYDLKRHIKNRHEGKCQPFNIV